VMCGPEVHVGDGRVASIRDNLDDTWSGGHICPKGATLGALHEDSDRRADDQGRRPMAGGQLEQGVPAVHRTAGADHRGARHRRGDLLHGKPARALIFARPLHRCAAGDVRNSDQLLPRHGRSVAEEPVVASDVRRMVVVPSARHRAHRPAGRDGRESARIAGLAARRTRRDGPHRRNSQAWQGD